MTSSRSRISRCGQRGVGDTSAGSVVFGVSHLEGTVFPSQGSHPVRGREVVIEATLLFQYVITCIYDVFGRVPYKPEGNFKCSNRRPNHMKVEQKVVDRRDTTMGRHWQVLLWFQTIRRPILLGYVSEMGSMKEIMFIL